MKEIKFKINNINWSVFFRQLDVYGETYPSTGRIIISEDLLFGRARQSLRPTIIHELVHAYLYSYGFFRASDENAKSFSEENLCEFIAMNLDTIHSLAKMIEDKTVL